MSCVQNKEFVMKANIFKGQWPQIKSGLKANWDKITDDDLDAVGLNEEQFMKILQHRYGYSADTAKREFWDFMKRQARTKGGRPGKTGTRPKGKGPRSIKAAVKQERTPVGGQRSKKVQRIGR